MALRHKPKHAAKTPTQKIQYKMLALIPVLALAVLCYCVSAFAWFQADIVNAGNVVRTTEYHLDVSVYVDGKPVEPQSALDTYTLEAGKVYDITLTAQAGGADNGYAMVQTDGGPLYTAQINRGALSFKLIPDATASYIFTAMWGIYQGTPAISNGVVIGTMPSADETNGGGAENAIHYETDAPMQHSAGPDSSAVSSSEPNATQAPAGSSSTPPQPSNTESVPSTGSDSTQTPLPSDTVSTTETLAESNAAPAEENVASSVSGQENAAHEPTVEPGTGESMAAPSSDSSDAEPAPEQAETELSNSGAGHNSTLLSR